MDNNKIKYASSWKKDSNRMNEDGIYDWMINQVYDYKSILEIGCGIGFSTIKLLEKKCDVCCIEANEYCIEETKKQLDSKDYHNVKFINKRISENNCLDIIKELDKKIDLVICWNPGGLGMFSLDEQLDIANDFKEVGCLEIKNANEFMEYYTEDIIKSACKIGKELNIDVSIIDRCKNENDFDDWYFDTIKNSYNFENVRKDSKKGTTNSESMLRDDEMFYVSYLFTRQIPN